MVTSEHEHRGSICPVFPPSRIVCLTEETVETLYLLGEQDRIVGVSGYAVRPPQARREKPRVSAFTSADIPKILALAPDSFFTFSDLQAEIAAELIRAGVAVHVVQPARRRRRPGDDPHRRGAGRRGRQGGGAGGEATRRLAETQAAARGRPRPRVYFEEWDDPMISGIGWVSELIEVAGGEDVFAALRTQKAAKDRIVRPEAVIAAVARPDSRFLVRQEGA